jgi:heme/copper-type cytochrome/quinol oxidase subunit 2
MKKVIGFLATLPALLVGGVALAEADAEIVSNSQAMMATAKDNIFGVIGANIGTIALVFVGILAIFLLFRFIRKAVGGR